MSALKFAAVGAPAAAVVYVEDVFSTYLYTGNGATQTITNGIDLSTKGGMVWTKNRNATQGNAVFDTVRGNTKYLLTQTTDGQQTSTDDITSFLSTGYTLGNNVTTGNTNFGTYTYASWTFRKQPKFFDIVTYTGNSVEPRLISHNLGSLPGMIIIKRTNSATAWPVYHRSLGANKFVNLNNTAISDTGDFYNAVPTSTNFSVSSNASVNISGGTYVAYLFAHDAGGFGLTGTDNVISCGTYTGVGANLNINLGYEPQWVMIKCTTDAVNWIIFDTMRGLPTSGNGKDLYPNVTDAEGDNSALSITSTGFLARTGIDGQVNATGRSYIYIAIRRGPMKVPTTGTSVFLPLTDSSVGGTIETVGFPVDLQIYKARSIVDSFYWNDRLRGINTNSTNAARPYLISSGTDAEASAIGLSTSVGNTTYAKGSGWSGASTLMYNFRRAPGFFDEVCYAGTGVAKTETHNLQAVPELMIVKSRAGIGRDWAVYIASMGNNYFACLNDGSFQGSSSTMWNDTTPTSSVFTVGTNLRTNNSGQTYVAYLFATCAGVSKVGSYTGNGTTQTINCGFATGARFVLIKRTDLAGDWYVWDSARGIVAGNDPHLSLNTTAAEVTTDDSVDTASSGFIVNQLAATNINVSAATYIFLSCS